MTNSHQIIIEILNRNSDKHINNQDWFAACGGLANTFETQELEEITEAAVSYRLSSCKKKQSEAELKQEIEQNYKRSHSDIGATLAAFKKHDFDLSESEYKTLRSLAGGNEFVPVQKSDKDLYEEQVEILQNLQFSKVTESLNFHSNHATKDAGRNFYLRGKLLSKVSSNVFFDAYRLRIPVQPVILGNDDIASFQTINIQGKKFETGFKVKGTAHFIPSKEEVFASSEVIICEGYATGESIYQASGIPTVCAMSKANMLLVAVALTEQDAAFELTLAADNDAIDECRKFIGIVNSVRGCNTLPAGIIRPDNDKRNGDFSDDWVANGGKL